ncbi:hypothetical protein [Clostridium beijerinckii]|uniref:hypothetical protein n=1 Tax=Clostridium beijerinckii TaxID=1520 RepID=UPI0009C8140B|nr:hypothetical protein [Clostridium beijerinckii]NRT77842.1 hypothetical protein [Clostridium beijerinckii]OOM39734.1 hypothetical protein CBEIJ_46910 [Clostridium beijerinckii]
MISKLKIFKIRLKLNGLLLIPLLSLILTSILCVIYIKSVSATLTESYYNKVYKINSLFLNSDKGMLETLTSIDKMRLSTMNNDENYLQIISTITLYSN